MPGIIGKKVGMTSIYAGEGLNIACTIVQAGPCLVTQVKDQDTDGYTSVQLGYGKANPKRVNKAKAGHYSKAGVDPMVTLKEFRSFEEEAKVGDEITVELFEEGDYVAVTGTSKGKGFQGVVKRHNFHGVGDATHGQHNRLRAPGSIGAASYPARVFKGMRMAGRTGSDKVKVKNLEVLKIFKEKNLILIKGALPGAKGSLVYIEK